MTKVKFYKEGKSVLAVFPEEIADGQYNMLCYAHLGQHSACSKEYIRNKKLAIKEEYKELLSELINQGYDDLTILNKK